MKKSLDMSILMGTRYVSRGTGHCPVPNTKGQKTLVHLPARNPSFASMIKRSPRPSFPSLTLRFLLLLCPPAFPISDPRRMEGLEVASMCHRDWPGHFLATRSKSGPESRRVDSNRVQGCMYICIQSARVY